MEGERDKLEQVVEGPGRGVALGERRCRQGTEAAQDADQSQEQGADEEHDALPPAVGLNQDNQLRCRDPRAIMQGRQLQGRLPAPATRRRSDDGGPDGRAGQRP